MRFINLPKVVMPLIHENEFLVDKLWAVIGITDPDEEPPVIVETETCKGVLRLQFHDIDVERASNYILFNESHAKQILQFTERMANDKVDVMLIHCHAGICRSSATAAALAKIYDQNNESFFTQFVPNRRVYRVLLETHSKGKDHGN